MPWDEHAPEPWETGEWDEEASKAIHDAAIQGNIPELTRLLELGADVDMPQADSADTWTPLLSVAYHFDLGPATREAYIATARVLLEHGADVDAVETANEWRTALHLVAASAEEAQDTPSDASGHEQGLKGPRAHSPLPISPSPDHKLHFLQLLVSHEADMMARNRAGETALHLAIKSRSSLAVINLMLTSDKNLLQAKDHNGEKAIHVAASHAHFEAAKLLLDSGANVDEPVAISRNGVQTIYTGNTPLLLACSCSKGLFAKPPQDDEVSCRTIVDSLILAGADIHATTPECETALQLAAKTGLSSVIEVLRTAGLSKDPAALISKDAEGATHPLIKAASCDHASLCGFLVRHDGADVNMTEPNGCKPLHVAAMSKHGDNADTILQLAALGADLEARIPSNGRRALHLAAATEYGFSSREKANSVAALLNLGAAIEAVDNSGWTALHFAAQRHHLSVLELLLDRGAQVGKTVADGPNWKRADGQEQPVAGYTAADLAKTSSGGAECVALLLSKGDRLSDETKDLVDEDLLEMKSDDFAIM